MGNSISDNTGVNRQQLNRPNNGYPIIINANSDGVIEVIGTTTYKYEVLEPTTDTVILIPYYTYPNKEKFTFGFVSNSIFTINYYSDDVLQTTYTASAVSHNNITYYVYDPSAVFTSSEFSYSPLIENTPPENTNLQYGSTNKLWDFAYLYFNGDITQEDNDPYADAGDSGTGGGDGTFDGSSDPVDIPSLPTVGATDAGFITLFAPTSSQLHALASYCWSNLFDVDTFKKLFNDPMDCILGLSVVPVSVPTSGAREITVGNIVTTVQMNVASQQYIEVDCGSISFANKYFGSYLDYEPYTKMAIFLPYCGTHQISADDVMGKTITVKYHIDILTGSCIAFVKCGDSVLYEFNGACASNIPVNSLNYSSTIENAIRIAVNIGTTVATAGASAPLSTASEGASALATAQNIGRGISLAGSTAEGALSMKPSVSRSGAMGGGVGLLGNQIPYMIITRPRLCKPKNQDHFEGYPSFIYSKIEDLIGQGFTSFTDVIISEQFLTDEEENELEAILKGGVYL